LIAAFGSATELRPDGAGSIDEVYNHRMLKIGASSPSWKGHTQDGSEISSEQFAGQWLLLYFYPEDDTSGCTAEACGFRDSFQELKDRISIVGVSGDDVASHKKFVDKYQLPFTLVADPLKETIKAFGTDGTVFPKRTTFLIDPSGIIQKIYHGFDEKEHAGHVQKDLEELGV
jgi:peroxiredoxin Q/BCP